MSTVVERLDSLESILGQFIVHTDVALRRLENEMREFKNEMREFKNEMKEFKDEMRNEMKEFKAEMKDFKDEMKDFKDEMKDFKDEMKDFKDEMKDFKDEMKDFKDEMKDFKDEMKDFKDEMKDFKDEMKDFKDEMLEETKKKNREWSNLAQKMGTLVEDLIAPALRPVLGKYFSSEVTMEGQRMFRRKDGNDYEVDAISADDTRVFMIEVKSSSKEKDIDAIVQKAQRFFEFFPEFEKKELVIIFGSITVPPNVVQYATKRSVYVMAWREWEYMDILNYEDIQNEKKRDYTQNQLTNDK